MDQEYKAHFKVHCAEIKEWERIHVVGSLPVLGEWNPRKSFPLIKLDNEENTFHAIVTVPSAVKEFQFRYLRVMYLDPSENSLSEPVMVLSKWETLYNPRTCLIGVESRNGVVRNNMIDEFGSYGGRTQISDGWILNEKENVVYFRIHGEALKFFAKSYANREYRLKVEPFDVRYSEMFSYTHKEINDRRGIWRHSSVYASMSIDGEDVVNLPTPELPCFSNTDLSVLTREDPIFGDQYFNGSVFRNDQDYLVFRTRTVSLQNLAFRIEFYHKEKRCALSYVLPSSMSGTHGATVSPVIGLSSAPVGHINVNYMIVKRSQYAEKNPEVDSMRETFGRYWRKRNRMLQIGHRGMGSSYTKNIDQRENTIFSLNEAARRGADYVELDVQLTKDLKTVVYHDFHLLVTVAGRDSPSNTPTAGGENKSLHEIAIKDLTLAQLKLLHFEHISRANGSPDSPVSLSVTPSKNETDELHVPFPSLAQVLRNVDENVGLNIEIKYPMYMKDGSHECEGYFEQNKFVDIILAEVAEHAGNRRIVFSCFEPDICTMITKKQHKYPVSFLVVGATNRYMPFQDIRSDCSKIAANFAAGCELLGVNFHSEELLIDRNPITIADKYGLVKFVWGDDLNSKEVQKHFKEEMNVDGLIFDRIGEDEVMKQNVFVVENHNRNSLFARSQHNSRSPSMSRRCMSTVE
uniref:GP-PDE domain-containing protein n=2 Tax=Caenorhabditis tropicalis TaxID=1561998 RepID=A0A1I7UAK0_9PELO